MAKPSIENPHYFAYILTDKGKTKYDVTGALLSMKIADNDGSLAPRSSISFSNLLLNGKWFNTLFNVGDVLQITSDNGGGEQPLGTHVIWSKQYNSEKEKVLSVTGYDQKLIYLQKSEDVRYYPKGKDTKAIVSDICSAWGVNVDYKFKTIAHELKQYRGNTLAEMILDCLEDVRKQTGEKYALYSKADGSLVIDYRGKNDSIYEFKAKKNAISTTSNVTMDGLVTKVKIYSLGDKGSRDKLETTIDGDTAKYGTLQKIMTKSSKTTLADAKKDAQQMIKDKGKPETLFTLEAIDIPWIKKGDKIRVAAGDMLADFYVLSITHDCTNKTMSMECEKV